MAYELLQDQFPVFRLLIRAFTPVKDIELRIVLQRGYCSDPWISVDCNNGKYSADIDFNGKSWVSELTPVQWYELLVKGCTGSIVLSAQFKYIPSMHISAFNSALRNWYESIPYGMKGIDENHDPYFQVILYHRTAHKHDTITVTYCNEKWKTNKSTFDLRTFKLHTLAKLVSGEKIDDWQIGAYFLPDKKIIDDEFPRELVLSALRTLRDHRGDDRDLLQQFHREYKNEEIDIAIEKIDVNES